MHAISPSGRLLKNSEEYKKILAKPHYNMYVYDYNIQFMKIDVDLELGKSLQKSNDQVQINQMIQIQI